MIRYAAVLIINKTSSLDKMFTYKYEDSLLEIKRGSFVSVPFGAKNKSMPGFVFEILRESHQDNLKEIERLNSMSLSEKQLEIVKIIRGKYLCTYSDAIRAIIPSCILNESMSKTRGILFIDNPLEGRYDKEIYKGIYKIVEENPGAYDKNTLSKMFKFSLSSINSMIKHSFLKEKIRVVNRYDNRVFPEFKELELNDEQQNAYDRITGSKDKVFLIKGVTGSGKTEVYMHLVKNIINKGKDAIILVPEISLTPQMVERFKGRFGSDITIYHSRLSEGEKQDEWQRVKNGEVKIAIGARSALFLPFNNLGLIIIDEEHEASYKSEQSPKYDSIELSKIMAGIYDAKLVLGSATPSVNSYYDAKTGRISLIKMDNRAYGKSLPKVSIVDMREELRSGSRSIFSRKLKEEIEYNLINKEQIILFINRRGFSSFVSCRSCGYVFKCDKCDVSMTYHISDNSMTCHYCGKKQMVPKVCPKCGSKYVKYFGLGTEKVEEELKRLYNNVRTIRMDYDTTREKNSYENIYNSFKAGEADVLIGTQMIAKGFDFRNVTLVGIIAADLSLNLPDYRSAERTYQLITQVSGRSGRGDKEGRVIVQTYTPEHYSIETAAADDYDKFYDEEIKIRAAMNYPPFSDILLINFSSIDEKEVIDNINKLYQLLSGKKYDLEILGPSPSGISKIKDNYRWRIILKGQIHNETAQEIKNLIYDNFKQISKSFKISLDINPNSFI
ncbi:MAG: primosomal protein N' [Bacillota bacterium]|nr:primosomal protein N' [Bacillota bacterium]